MEAFGGRPIRCDGLLDDLDDVDAIVVAPVVTDPATVIAQTGPTVDWLVQRWRSGVTLTGVCTGTVLLAETHILDDRVATTNPGLVALFDRQRRHRQIRERQGSGNGAMVPAEIARKRPDR